MRSRFPDEIDYGGKSELSRRELEILGYVALGFTNAEIGKLLSIQMETAKSHTKAMIMKMRARNRTHLVTLAIEQGLLTIHILNDTRYRFQQSPRRHEIERKRGRAVP